MDGLFRVHSPSASYPATTTAESSKYLKDSGIPTMNMIRRVYYVIVCCALLGAGRLYGQTKTISGSILDASTNEPLIAATIRVVGSARARSRMLRGTTG